MKLDREIAIRGATIGLKDVFSKKYTRNNDFLATVLAKIGVLDRDEGELIKVD